MQDDSREADLDGRKNLRPSEASRKNENRRSQESSYGTLEKYRMTPRSEAESIVIDRKSRRDERNQETSPQRKVVSKSPQRQRFTDTLIKEWCKGTGLQMPQAEAQESRASAELEQKCAAQERRVEILRRKLQEAEKSLAMWTSTREAEALAKDECLKELNSVWERVEEITKYSQDISDTIAEFQRLYADLSIKYEKLVQIQSSDLKISQARLTELNSRDEEQKKQLTEMRAQLAAYERRIREMVDAQDHLKLKTEIEKLEDKLIKEKDQLIKSHTEEKLKLVEEQERLMSSKEKLEFELNNWRIENEKIVESRNAKDQEISSLRTELINNKKEIENLLCQNAELTAKCERSAQKEDELLKQLQAKANEMTGMRRNLEERQKIETELANDLKILEINFSSVKEKLKEAHEERLVFENELKNSKRSSQAEILELKEKIDLLKEENRKIIWAKDSEIKEVKESLDRAREENRKLREISKENPEKEKEKDLVDQEVARKASIVADSPLNSKRVKFDLTKTPLRSSQKEFCRPTDISETSQPVCLLSQVGSQIYEPNFLSFNEGTGEKKFFKNRGVRQYDGLRKNRK